MGARAVWWYAWAAVSAVLVAVVKETLWSTITDTIIKGLGYTRGADVIAAMVSFALPLTVAAAAVGLVYVAAYREGRKIGTPETAARPTSDVKEWLHPADAFVRFANPALVAKRRATEVRQQELTERKQRLQIQLGSIIVGVPANAELAARARELSGEIEEITFQLALADASPSVADRRIQEDIYARLVSGALVAKGIMAPVAESSTEVIIRPEWWRFLTAKLDTAEARGHNAHIVGLLIGKPDQT